MQRVIVHRALAGLPAAIQDPLPADIRAREQLVDRRAALVDVHFPPAGTPIGELNAFRSPAQRRLIFEEFFLFQLGLVLKRRKADDERKARAVVVTDEIRESARRVLPFRLTGDQKKVIAEIVEDMKRPQPMNRLLQGDVGSGKTIVALIAAIVAMENGFQVAFMAPTEILAEQHFITIRQLLESSRFRMALVTGATTAKKRREVQAELSGGSIHLVVGTHALVEDPVGFRELGLVIIDEQHRFGVLQRAELSEKGFGCDLLFMTATPIPRTLALTLHGDLQSSILDELPPGRKPIVTERLDDSDLKRVFHLMEREIEKGHQVYFVCPLVEESEKMDLKAAVARYESLAQGPFRSRRVALVHGKMAAEEREAAMDLFARGKVDVLVATTVVEVGVDVKNATLMVIEHAERFGLAQLHQLRGRVGRGPAPSRAILLTYEPATPEAEARGRSRGGFSTPIPALTDALGHPLDVELTGGQAADITPAEGLLPDAPGAAVVADKG